MIKSQTVYYINSSLYIFFLFCIGVFPALIAQELPPVSIYTTDMYGADNQNWSITQTEDRQIFVANNKGLLQYNGEKWRLYPSPNQSILRSAHALHNTVFTGCYRDFGFWNRDEKGLYHYHSLVDEFNLELEENEQFWKILNFEKYIIFQSLDNIFIYDSEANALNRIKNVDEVYKTFIVQNQIYFSAPQKGIYQITNGKAKLVNDAEVFTNNLVINLYQIGKQILVQTDNQGIFTFEDIPKPWGGSQIPFLQSVSVYNSLQLNNGDIVLGTISNGAIFISKEGRVTQQLKQQKSLTNNTILCLYEDVDHNVWLGLDNGINCINQASPFHIYNDTSGNVGTVYTSIAHDGFLYLGTNQGLFYRPLDNPDEDFKLMRNSNGQVWDLFLYDDRLFCGHNNGAYVVKDFQLIPLATIPFSNYSESGTWCFKIIPNRPDLLLLGNYAGLSILQKNGSEWEFRNTIKGFNVSSKFVEFSTANKVLVNHEYKGVFGLELDDDFSEIKSLKIYDEADKGLYSSIANIGGVIFYLSEKGVFKHNKQKDRFELDSILTDFKFKNNNKYSSGKLIPIEGSKSFWSFTNKSINYISPSKLSENYEFLFIPIPNDVRNAMVGYENLTQLKDNIFLFGNSHGYILIDLAKVKNQIKSIEVELSSVSAYPTDGHPFYLSLTKEPTLQNVNNNINFSFSTTLFDEFYQVEYQYKLTGLNETWSEWSENNEVAYNNLSFGTYVFEVRSRLGDIISDNTVQYTFTIERPFMLSNQMLFVYGIILILLIFIIHSVYKQYYKYQKKKLKKEAEKEIELKELEAQRKIMRINNDKLKQDIEYKNRELAISTMSLVKKNEFLARIKSDLQAVKKKENNLDGVIKVINKNINNSDDWKFFEEAFNNADKDFLKKIKSKHPSLTPNDLKLCAYLRLNLSSKEIAPLFNISTRSVEVKRYRLRRKMGLPHEASLTNYILDL